MSERKYNQLTIHSNGRTLQASKRQMEAQTEAAAFPTTTTTAQWSTAHPKVNALKYLSQYTSLQSSLTLWRQQCVIECLIYIYNIIFKFHVFTEF